jgi:3-oxoacyl-[acyl-carrier-protein] synthase II
MALTTRRAVFTGIGVLTPIGHCPEDFWSALSSGRSGITAISSFDASRLPVRIAGEIRDFDAREYVEKKDRKSLKVMARTIQLAVAAAQRAFTDSGVDRSGLDPDRFGVEFGASLIASELGELGPAAQRSVNGQADHVDLESWGTEGLAHMPPLWMLKYLPNMLACHVAIMHDARGPNNSITESDVASLLAIGEAYRILRRDQADFFLTGSGESKLNPLSLARQCLFQDLSKRNSEPERASRPFDLNRDGMVIGEGAGILVLEDLDHARRRGARIYAELAGFGSAFDRDRQGHGIAAAIRAAMADAGIGPKDLDHINAHGVSSEEGDAWEARGIGLAFGSENPPILAVKSYIGNLGAASGSTELVASLLAFHQGRLPGTLNYEQADSRCPVKVAVGGPMKCRKPYAIKLGFTELGQCAALVLRRWEDS